MAMARAEEMTELVALAAGSAAAGSSAAGSAAGSLAAATERRRRG